VDQTRDIERIPDQDYSPDAPAKFQLPEQPNTVKGGVTARTKRQFGIRERAGCLPSHTQYRRLFQYEGNTTDSMQPLPNLPHLMHLTTSAKSVQTIQ